MVVGYCPLRTELRVGIAERKVAVGAVEKDAPRGEPIKVRRLRHRIAVAADAAVEVVDDDEEDVGLG